MPPQRILRILLLNSFVWPSMIIPAVAQDVPKGGPKSASYLALGDSLPFGYNPLVQPPDLSDYVGYSSIISTMTQDSLTNASCPYETTATFLTGGTTPDGAFGCQFWRNESGLKKPLFVSYSGPQIDYAISYLQHASGTQLVTIQLGGNDLADLELTCNNNPVCELAGLPATLAQVGANLSSSVARIRATGYSGQIVLVNYYVFNYLNLLQSSAFSALAQTMATVAASSPNVKIADAFKAFALVSAPYSGDTCAAGLRIKLSAYNPQTGDMCDVHPTFEGHAVLASAIFAAIAN
jgi:lysophospholipase L1-like esterase